MVLPRWQLPMGGDAEHAFSGIDQETRPRGRGVEAAVVAVIAVAQTEGSVSTQRIAAQYIAVGDEAARMGRVGTLLPGGGIEVAAVKGAAVVADAGQSVCRRSVVRLPACRVPKRSGWIVAQIVAVKPVGSVFLA